MAADEQFHSDYTEDCGVDTSFCSDDFEKLSIPCSESVSAYEAFEDTTKDEHLLKTADMSETARAVPTLSYEVRRPPVISAHDDMSPAMDGDGRASLCTDLIVIANSIEKSMVYHVV